MNKTTIAIIDNWEIYREGIAGSLEGERFHTSIKAYDSKELLMKIDNAANYPDVCIFNANILAADLSIPSNLKSKWPSMKVVAYTPNDSESLMSLLKDVGLDRYIHQYDNLEKELIKLQLSSNY